MFTDLHKHANFMRTSSQMGQERSEIPRADPAASSRDIDSPVAQWLANEARQKLADTMNKLGLDSTRILGKHLGTYSADELEREKKKVKNELKYYDQAFIQKF